VHELDALLMPSKTVAEDYNRIFPEGRAIAAPLQIIPSAKPRHRCEAEVNETLDKYALPKEFFYTPNQFWVHKNHGVIIEAMALLAAKGECPHVVSTGKQFDSRDPEYFSRLMRLAQERGVCDYFHVLGVIPYEDTVTLMQSCMAVVSSSRFEGWGLSVAEARILGKKVILTDIPVFREQNPARGLFYDPDDAVSLADHMLDVSRAYEPAKEAEECQKAAPDHAELVKAYARGYEDIVFLAASRKRGNQSPLSIVSPRMFRRPI
jgi:glycosyltransferase involved in cell wall biosynthesis